MLTILKTNTYRAVVPLDLEIFVKMRPKCEHSGNSQQCVTHELSVSGWGHAKAYVRRCWGCAGRTTRPGDKLGSGVGIELPTITQRRRTRVRVGVSLSSFADGSLWTGAAVDQWQTDLFYEQRTYVIFFRCMSAFQL
eukprot:143819-Prorocentrum_minimum.AAC.1